MYLSPDLIARCSMTALEFFVFIYYLAITRQFLKMELSRRQKHMYTRSSLNVEESERRSSY